jgi:hypothetical protein
MPKQRQMIFTHNKNTWKGTVQRKLRRVKSSVAEPDPDPNIVQDLDPLPGCLGSGSGSISYTHEHNKINLKGELNEEYLLCGPVGPTKKKMK